jgi:ribosomal protein S18 acetylase RimI-like enzyme
MAIITIDGTNIADEHICCAIGTDKANQARAETKKDWLRREFANGLVFKRLDQRGKVFIEYMPIEAAWKPIEGSDYLAINCLWVSGQFKGQGHAKALLDECVADAKRAGKAGIVAVTSAKTKPFLTDKRFYLSQGFETIDTAPPYFELVALRLDPTVPPPRFTARAKTGKGGKATGFTFIYSNQCVFMEEYVALLQAVAREAGVPAETVKLQTAAQAQAKGSPFGTLGIYRDGEFLTHELTTADKFRKLIAAR